MRYSLDSNYAVHIPRQSPNIHVAPAHDPVVMFWNQKEMDSATVHTPTSHHHIWSFSNSVPPLFESIYCRWKWWESLIRDDRNNALLFYGLSSNRRVIGDISFRDDAHGPPTWIFPIQSTYQWTPLFLWMSVIYGFWHKLEECTVSVSDRRMEIVIGGETVIEHQGIGTRYRYIKHCEMCAKSRQGVVDMMMQHALKMLILRIFTRKC